MNKVKLVPTIFVKIMIQIVFYSFCLLFRVKKKKVTFASYRSDKLTGNLYFIWRELQKQYPNYESHFVFKKFKASALGKFSYFIHMVRACYYLATSRYFVIDDYYFPIYVIKPRKGTEVIQLWHGSGALKKFGLSTIGKSYGPSLEYLKHVKIHSNYSRVYVSSSEVVPFYAEAFGMPKEQIYPLGIPRTDYFFATDEIIKLKDRFYQAFPELIDKKLILYAPTYRGKSHDQESFACPIDISYMKEKLESEYALLIHLHPYMQSGLILREEDLDFAYHIHDNFHIQELLVLADLLITDYSTVFVDYSLLCRPIAFFANDLQEYVEQRDFYYDYESIIPGPLFNETSSLIEWIQEEKFDLQRVNQFRQRFFDYIDGNASKRIVKHFIEVENEISEDVKEKVS
ncbi:CDP-glycerol glycerophosphotransferase family protein [Heyndrickxia sp. NPDC080065]|uniref:CDP-glycerol glycerophosphotransferase family protein n=1 Tax=Heyndrickxia sp. NPDC080065 TaxID=3390568 RepID=UPI003CFD4979